MYIVQVVIGGKTKWFGYSSLDMAKAAVKRYDGVCVDVSAFKYTV